MTSTTGIPIPGRHFEFGPRVVSDEPSPDGDNESDVEGVSLAEAHLEALLQETLLMAEAQPAPPPAPSASETFASVQEDDVLCGRGGETNHHPGNVRYRGLVKKYQRLYLKAKRRDKPKIARLIVDTVRRKHGRFLKKDISANAWLDVGNNKAREKTSQALREGAPELRNEDKEPLEPGVEESAPEGTHFKKRKRMSKSEIATPIVSPTPSSSSLVVDEDDAKAWPSPYSRQGSDASRGPRLKILKSRLMCNETLEE